MEKPNSLQHLAELLAGHKYNRVTALTDLLGEQKIVDGEIKEIRLMDHKIIIKENK